MNGITTTAAILLALAAYTLLADPAVEPLQTSAPAGCTGDYVCGDDASVVATRPLARRETPGRVRQQTVAGSGGRTEVSDVLRQ